VEETEFMTHHGLLLGCQQPLPSPYEAVDYKEDITIKRAAGAHKIASHMRNEGWDIEVVDYWLAFTVEEFIELINSRITADTVFVGLSLTFSIYGSLIDKANQFIRLIRKYHPHVAIIAGSKNLYVTSGLKVDYHLTGYGEFGLMELCKKILGKEHSLVMTQLGRSQYVDCDKNHPCYPHKDLSVKYEERDFLLPHEHVTLEFARGCKFACKFCAYNIIGVKGDYTRDMPSLGDELKRNYDMFGVSNYYVADETTNDSTQKLREIADQVKQLSFMPSFSGYIRADLIASRPDDRELLAEMGMWGHYYGIESLTHKAAKTIGKGMHPDKLKQGLLDVRDYFKSVDNGYYRATFSMILGLPYDTKELIMNNLEWITHNFPEEAIMAFPLWLSNQVDQNLENITSSEFDRTWSTSGDFWDELGTDTSFGASADQLPEMVRKASWENYNDPKAIKWQHDNMNWWEANKLMADVLLSKHTIGKGHLNWFLGSITSTGKFSMQEALDLKNNDPINQIVKDATVEHIESYKSKKLSL
jgi:hypothetical protein